MSPMPELFGNCLSLDEVKNRYKYLAGILHPDKNLHQPEAAHLGFQQLQSEYTQALEIVRAEQYQNHVSALNEVESRKAYPRYIRATPWGGLKMALCDRLSARLWCELLWQKKSYQLTREDYEWFLNWLAALRVKPKQQQQLDPVALVPTLTVFNSWEDY